MPKNLRFPPPPAADREIARRIRSVREVDCDMSLRLFAFSYGWALQQLHRIERGTVAPRFGPTWEMCFLVQINPLWLAFGESYDRYGCADFPVFERHPELSPQMPFVTVMREIGDNYLEQCGTGSGVVFEFREQLANLTAKFAELIPARDRPRFLSFLATMADRFVAGKALSNKVVDSWQNLKNKWSTMASPNDLLWQQLRQTVVEKTKERGARARLARQLKVSPQALNEWLQGRNAPAAEQTLRLVEWVGQIGAQPTTKKRAETAVTAPARTTKKGSSTTNEKNRSSQQKK